jgi:hypothetical protein
MRLSAVYRIVEFDCGHLLALVPFDTAKEDLPDFGPWTKADYRQEMVCLPCDAWRTVIGDVPRIVEETCVDT